ncbi:MAG: YfiR family protein [Methylococcaceae bacterium]|nr:YfiR family protein [Methylococcaceae bacterium]
MSKHNYHKKNGCSLLMVFLFILLFFSSLSVAQGSRIEYKIKAGYLYNFTKFISWPENKSKTFNICILGTDPFGSIINPIEKRTVHNKPIRLYRYQKVSEIKQCHIVYLGESEDNWGNSDLSFSGVLTISSLEKTLTVSDSRQITQAGGMISFFLEEGKVKLLVNLQALRKSGLEVSAKLLEVAEIYQGGADD